MTPFKTGKELDRTAMFPFIVTLATLAAATAPRAGRVAPSLFSPDCGLTASRNTAGDRPAKPGDFPWMAALFTTSGDAEPALVCGGSLVTHRYVLTAAHCLDPAIAFVRLGEHNLLTDPDCWPADCTPSVLTTDSSCSSAVCAPLVLTVKVEGQVVHPDYNSSDIGGSDIGLLRLQEIVIFNDYISPICVSPSIEMEFFVKTRVVTAGWGRSEFGASSSELVSVTLPVVDEEECFKLYPKLYHLRLRQLCIGDGTGPDSCSGDSGGPVFRFGADGRAAQVAVISFGSATCGSAAAVYTYVAPYVEDFILPNIDP